MVLPGDAKRAGALREGQGGTLRYLLRDLPMIPPYATSLRYLPTLPPDVCASPSAEGLAALRRVSYAHTGVHTAVQKLTLSTCGSPGATLPAADRLTPWFRPPPL
eukprot:1639622-Rhodomonas_salina.3